MLGNSPNYQLSSHISSRDIIQPSIHYNTLYRACEQKILAFFGYNTSNQPQKEKEQEFKEASEYFIRAAFLSFVPGFKDEATIEAWQQPLCDYLKEHFHNQTENMAKTTIVNMLFPELEEIIQNAVGDKIELAEAVNFKKAATTIEEAIDNTDETLTYYTLVRYIPRLEISQESIVAKKEDPATTKYAALHENFHAIDASLKPDLTKYNQYQAWGRY